MLPFYIDLLLGDPRLFDVPQSLAALLDSRGASASFVRCWGRTLGVQIRRFGRKVWIHGVGFLQLLLCGEPFTVGRGLFLTRGRLSPGRRPQSLLSFLP
jgi:hypothetical protein